METREIGALVILILGFSLLVFGLLIPFAGNVLLFYGLPLFIVGLIVYFNKGEDKIESVNYSRMKGGLKK